MARSLQQQIDDNDAAIEAAETSQAYTIRGRSQQRALLKDLYAERRHLRGLQSEEDVNSGSMATVGVIDTPR